MIYFFLKNVSVEKVAKTEYRWNYLHRKKNFKKSLTLVHASGCSFNVVRTSWAIFCWSPVPEYKVPTTVSKRPMSIFWLKSRSLLTVSWAKAVILELTFVKNFQWKNSRLHFPGAQSKLLCVTGVNQITPVYATGWGTTKFFDQNIAKFYKSGKIYWKLPSNWS